MEENVALKEYSTFGIGGPARFLVKVKTVDELRQAVQEAQRRQLPFFVLGRGSNCLFDDRGFPGIVIVNKIDFIEETDSGRFHVGAGYNFSLLGTQTARKGWSGLEFASGIPGSVGGAVFMNAGANGTETCNSLISVEFLDSAFEVQCVERKNLNFAYRHSPFQNTKDVIVAATFQLVNSSEARQKQIEIIDKRKNSQPYKAMSAGCYFRNPSTISAGALLDQHGLKGLQIGGAKVSEVHANFIVNSGNATAGDVLTLIETIREHIRSKTGIELESEVRFIPYEFSL